MTQENQHIETFKASAAGRGWPTRVSITGTQWTLQMDEPVADGGSNSGPNPMQLFIASIAGCQNEQAQVVIEELSLNVNAIDINLEIDLDLAGFMGNTKHSDGAYKEVRLQAVVQGDATEEQIQELGARVDRRCPILGLLRSSGCKIISSWSAA
ncbi:MAG: OsmC family protein [Bacteroidota bacterium]